MDERSAVVTIGGKGYEMLLTTKATKASQDATAAWKTSETSS